MVASLPLGSVLAFVMPAVEIPGAFLIASFGRAVENRQGADGRVFREVVVSRTSARETTARLTS